MSISIIIPTLDEEDYIGKLLDCLSKQTYDNFEVIVVDANSKDNTKKIIRKFSEKLDIRQVDSNKKNVAYQRNLGVKKAKYGNLLFLDADVLFDNDFLLSSLSEIDKTRTDIAIPRYLPLFKKWYYHVFCFFVNLTFFLTQKIKPCGIGMCIFSNKDTHDRIGGFSEKLAWTDDMHYIRSIKNNGKFLRLNAKIYFSVRRFEKEGTKMTMKKWITAYFFTVMGKESKINKISYF